MHWTLGTTKRGTAFFLFALETLMGELGKASAPEEMRRQSYLFTLWSSKMEVQSNEQILENPLLDLRGWQEEKFQHTANQQLIMSQCGDILEQRPTVIGQGKFGWWNPLCIMQG